MRKKINLLILIISMLILNISSSYAAEKNNPIPEDLLLNIALEALETENNIRLQSSTMSTYFVYDFNNRDITASFKNIAYPMYASNNINDLQCYCHNKDVYKRQHPGRSLLDQKIRHGRRDPRLHGEEGRKDHRRPPGYLPPRP